MTTAVSSPLNQEPKFKKYLNKRQKEIYEKLLKHQELTKGNSELYKERKKVTDRLYKHMKQKGWTDKNSEAVDSNKFLKLFNNFNKAGMIWHLYQ